MSDQEAIETAKRDFDKEANVYDQPHTVLRAQAVAEAIRRQVRLDRKMDVMDYGAGTGLVTLAIQPYVRSITAVDSSRGMLAVLREKTKARGITNVRTLFCDFDEEGLSDVCFHLVISAMTLHHVRDVSSLLRRFHGLLRSDGVLAIADLDAEEGDFHPDKTGVWHHGFEREWLKRQFEEAGFRSVEASTAHTMSKEVEDGVTKDFPIFLMTGRKA